MPQKKKAVARKPAPPQKKPAVKAKSAAPKHAAPKFAAAKPAAKPALKTVKRVKPAAPAPQAKPQAKSPYGANELERFKKLLLDLRARLTGQISSLANESLTVADETPSEDRTDDFDREFALNVAGSVQDALFEIDEALRRILEGRYGICEISGKAIEKERLKALPYARFCVAVQQDMERGRTRYRPFGNPIVQAPDHEPGAVEAEEPE